MNLVHLCFLADLAVMAGLLLVVFFQIFIGKTEHKICVFVHCSFTFHAKPLWQLLLR